MCYSYGNNKISQQNVLSCIVVHMRVCLLEKRREQKEGRTRERGRGLGEQNYIQNTKKRKGVKAGKKKKLADGRRGNKREMKCVK